MCAHHGIRSGLTGPTVESYLGNCVIDDLLVSHIALVSDQELVDALGGVSVDLLQPLLHVVERIHVGDIVNDADAVGTPVVRRGDGSETFLTCGIPLCGGECLSAAVSTGLGRGRHLGWARAGSQSAASLSCRRARSSGFSAEKLAGRRLDVAMTTRAYKVNTDCGDVRLGVSVVGESQKQAGLSNTGVSDEEQFEEVIVSR